MLIVRTNAFQRYLCINEAVLESSRGRTDRINLCLLNGDLLDYLTLHDLDPIMLVFIMERL